MGVIADVALRSRGELVEFGVDDGSGVVPCVLFCPPMGGTAGRRMTPEDLAAREERADAIESRNGLKVGALARVRGRVNMWGGA